MTAAKRQSTKSTTSKRDKRPRRDSHASQSSTESSIDDEVEWQWQGKPTSFRGTKYYENVSNSDGEAYQVGDCVEILISGRNKPTCCAIIESMFVTKGGEKMIEARWFESPRDIPRYKREYVMKHDRELFETNHVDECGLESIVRKVRVVEYGKFKSIMQRHSDLVKSMRISQSSVHGDGPLTTDNVDPDAISDEEGFAFKDTYVCNQFYSFQIRVTRPVRSRQPGFYSKRLQTKHKKRPSQGDSPISSANQEGDTITRVEESFSKACRHLQLSSVPHSLPCREGERAEVHHFLKSAIARGGVGSSLYISGMPGTGKTATVLEVVRALEDEMENDQLPPFQFVEINGMKLPHPYQAYSHLYRELTGRSVSHSQAAQLLEKRFSGQGGSGFGPAGKRIVTVVLVDELDYMVTRKQTVVYNLFDWPTRKNSRLVVIGIANTMDLPERLLPRIHSRLGMGRVVFQPYAREQIETIIKARIEYLKVFKPEAVGMCARKVASCSGDIRRALQICRRAAEICAQNFLTKYEENPSPNEPPTFPRVTIRDINAAATELQQCIQTKAIKSAPLLDKLVLSAIYRLVNATGTELMDFEDIWTRFSGFCRMKTLYRMPTKHEMLVICRRLGSSRILLLEEQHNERTPKIRLGVEVDDIKFAYSEDMDCYKLLSQ